MQVAPYTQLGLYIPKKDLRLHEKVAETFCASKIRGVTIKRPGAMFESTEHHRMHFWQNPCWSAHLSYAKHVTAPS